MNKERCGTTTTTAKSGCQTVKEIQTVQPFPTSGRRRRHILVKGGTGSRLLRKAHRISALGKDRSGKPLKVLSEVAQEVFGDFGGHISIQRSSPHCVSPGFVEKAIKFVTNLR